MPWNAVLPSVKTAAGWVRTYPAHPVQPPATLIWGCEADSLRGLGMVDGDLVSTVACLGTGGNATASGTARPVYKVASLYGHDTFLFDSFTDCLAMPAAGLAALQNLSSALITVVYKLPVSAVTGTRSAVAWSTGTTTGARASIQQNVTATNVHTVTGRRLDADSFGSVAGSVGSTTGEIAVLTADYRWTTSDLFLYKNGDLIGSSLSFQTSGSTSNTASLTGFIGANAAGSGEFFSGEIAGIYVYPGNDLTGTKRSAVHTYILQKFGIRSWDMPAFETTSGFGNTSASGYREDFPTTFTVGQATNMTTGPDLGLLNPASAGGGAAGSQGTYAASFKTATDESVTGEASGARYSTVRTTSVAVGSFGGGNSLYIHQLVTGGIPYGGKFKPLLPFGADVNKTTYASYKYGLRYLNTATSTSFGGVFDLIDSATWSSGSGEYGHPECNYFTSPYGSYIRDSDHVANPNRSGHVIRRNATTYSAPSGLNSPHVNEIRNQPGRTQLIIHDPGTLNTDGFSIWDDTAHPVSDPLGFVWQCGAGSLPGSSEVADFEIAWVTISPWVGGKGLPDQELAGTMFAAGTPILSTDWEFATVASPISNADMWTGVGSPVGNNTSTFEDASIVNLGAPHNKVINHFNLSGSYISSANDYGMSMFAPLAATSDEATISYDVRFTTPNSVTSTNPWGKGGKLPGLCGIAPGHGVTDPPSGGSPTIYGWSGRAMFITPGAGFGSESPRTPVEWIGYIYDPLQTAGSFGQNRRTGVGWEGSGGVAVGTWVNVKQYYKMNTVTVDGSNWSANGIHRMYWDTGSGPVLVYEKTDQVFRKYTAGRITHLAYDVFYGGGDVSWAPSGDTNIQIDNLLITTP